MKPDDEYLLKLGLAHYWFQYVEWAVIYALHQTTGEDVSVLATQTPRHLSNKLNDAWQLDPTLAMLASRYAELVTNREHLAHSHPATTTPGCQSNGSDATTSNIPPGPPPSSGLHQNGSTASQPRPAL